MLEAIELILSFLFPDPVAGMSYAEGGFGLMAGQAIAQGLGSFLQGRRQRQNLQNQEQAMLAQQEIAQQQAAARQQAADQAAEMARQGVAEADLGIEKAIKDREGLEFGLAPTYNKLRQEVMQDPMADLQRQEALRSQAASVEALRGGGARALLGGLGGVQQGTADRMSRIAAEEAQRRRAGLENIAAAEQRASDQTAAQRFASAAQDLSFARDLKEGALGAQRSALADQVRATDASAAVQGMGVDAGLMGQQADLAGRGALANALTGTAANLFNMAQQNRSGEGGGGGGLKRFIGGLFNRRGNQNQPAPQSTGGVGTFGGGGSGSGLLDNVDLSFLNNTGGSTSGSGGGGFFSRLFNRGEEGMLIEAMEGALLRGETPGEFSHDKNPIDIMQDGAKIGEMTGGEGIVSPEDMGKMEQLAGKGDTDLHKFVRKWFHKINNKNSK